MTGTSSPVRGRARVTEHRTVCRNYREMRLEYTAAHGPAPPPLPGQFFTILPTRYPVPLLRRPFAYSDAKEDGFSFIYEILGPATRDLAVLEIGDELDWMGPLGTYFPSPKDGGHPILVAGGIGIGPMVYLAAELHRMGYSSTLVVGARSQHFVPDIPWPDALDLRICTDDGTMGRQGTVMAVLPDIDAAKGLFYACGPLPMMKAVQAWAVKRGRPCYVSLEEMMACGVGACQGCAVPTVDPHQPARENYERACVEGPVFESRTIRW